MAHNHRKLPLSSEAAMVGVVARTKTTKSASPVPAVLVAIAVVRQPVAMPLMTREAVTTTSVARPLQPQAR